MPLSDGSDVHVLTLRTDEAAHETHKDTDNFSLSRYGELLTPVPD
jgi:hypothetical protein